MLIVDCVTRFAICSLIVDTKATTLIGIPINDRARPIGKPRLIISDACSMGTSGTDWGEFSRAVVIQLIHAPRPTPYQHGLAERAARSLKSGIRAILTENGTRPSQKVLTRAVMARHHVPRTVTGIPPGLAMTGRSVLLAGHAETEWTQNPDTVDPAVLQSNAMSHILAARTAVMAADAERALTTCLQRYLPDRSNEFYHIGDQVHIAMRGVWDGAWSDVAHAPRNPILEKEARLLSGPELRHGESSRALTTRLTMHCYPMMIQLPSKTPTTRKGKRHLEGIDAGHRRVVRERRATTPWSLMGLAGNKTTIGFTGR